MSYRIYGSKAEERDDNRGLTADRQQVEATELIYETDNKQEAIDIMNAGGFIRDGVWHVAQKVETDDPNRLGSEKAKAIGKDQI